MSSAEYVARHLDPTNVNILLKSVVGAGLINGYGFAIDVYVIEILSHIFRK